MLNSSSALELAYIAVEEALRLKSTYADARFEAKWGERVGVAGGRVLEADAGTERGLSIRVLHGGAWGFAAVAEPTRHDIGVAVRRAVELARAAAILQEHPVELAAAETARGADRADIRRDPMGVPLADKVAWLRAFEGALRQADDVRFSQASFQAERRRGVWVSSEGSELEQDRVFTGLTAEVGVTGLSQGVARQLLGAPGLLAGTGWELVEAVDVDRVASGLVEESRSLRGAEAGVEGTMDLILGASETAAQIAGGLAAVFELDRVAGMGPEGQSGTFLHPSDLGSRRLGSEQVNLSADARLPGGAGSFAFDMEGVAAESLPLIREGRVSGFLSSRETAARVGLERSQGCLRSPGWWAPPRPRATNLRLEPGTAGDLEELIASTDAGLLVEGPRRFSLDPSGQTFVASGTSGWLIEGGRRTKRVLNPSYRGGTETFWQACDAVGSSESSEDFGGRAADGLPMSFRAPPTRFRAVEVGTLSSSLVDVPAGQPLPIAIVEPEIQRSRPRSRPRLRARRPRRDVK